jgi:hypothetical protein
MKQDFQVHLPNLEVLMPLTITVFCVMTPCEGVGGCQSSGGTSRLHLQTELHLQDYMSSQSRIYIVVTPIREIMK